MSAGGSSALSIFSLKELRTKAKELGIDEDVIEGARDANEPKEAMIKLIEAHPKD